MRKNVKQYTKYGENINKNNFFFYLGKTPLNPASNVTWQVIDSLIKESTTIFIDNFIHLGGDEVKTSCWSSTSSIESWMSANNFTTKQALQYFEEKAQGIAHSYGKNVTNWVEVFNLFNNTIDPSYVTIQVWKESTYVKYCYLFI